MCCDPCAPCRCCCRSLNSVYVGLSSVFLIILTIGACGVAYNLYPIPFAIASFVLAISLFTYNFCGRVYALRTYVLRFIQRHRHRNE
jgi:hypothetical protein